MQVFGDCGPSVIGGPSSAGAGGMSSGLVARMNGAGGMMKSVGRRPGLKTGSNCSGGHPWWASKCSQTGSRVS